MDVIFSLEFAIKNLTEKINNPFLYTKFDSINDSFNGIMGELAFEKFLEKNFSNIKYRNFKNFNENDYVKVKDKKYDKYDIILEKNLTNNIHIDIKTQSFRKGEI